MEYYEYSIQDVKYGTDNRAWRRMFLNYAEYSVMLRLQEVSSMKLETVIGSGCHGGSCPTVYKTDRGSFVVQGNLVNSAEVADIQVPASEGLVEIPESLVAALVSRLNNQR